MPEALQLRTSTTGSGGQGLSPEMVTAINNSMASGQYSGFIVVPATSRRPQNVLMVSTIESHSGGYQVHQVITSNGNSVTIRPLEATLGSIGTRPNTDHAESTLAGLDLRMAQTGMAAALREQARLTGATLTEAQATKQANDYGSALPAGQRLASVQSRLDQITKDNAILDSQEMANAKAGLSTALREQAALAGRPITQAAADKQANDYGSALSAGQRLESLRSRTKQVVDANAKARAAGGKTAFNDKTHNEIDQIRDQFAMATDTMNKERASAKTAAAGEQPDVPERTGRII